MSSYTGGVDKVIAAADRSDPVRAAVVEVLATQAQDFVAIQAAPFSEAEQTTMIENWMKGDFLSQSQSKLELLRIAEAAAGGARHVTVSIPDAAGRYWEQVVVIPSATSDQRYVTFNFDVPFANREAVAADLVARIAPLFAVDPKWSRSQSHDPKLNPMFGQTTYMTYLDMGMTGSSTILMVTVQYSHGLENHEALEGVTLQIAKLKTTTG